MVLILTNAEDAMMQLTPPPFNFGVEQQKDAVLAAVIDYLSSGTLPPDNTEAKQLIARSSELALVNGML